MLVGTINSWLSEALPILSRHEERLDHLSVDVVAVELVEFVQPEVVAVKVSVGIVVRIPSQITEVLHQHKSAIEFLLRDIPADAGEIVGAANQPTGWRGGTGKLGLLLRDPQGGLRWQLVAPLQLSAGPACRSRSEPVQFLNHYRLVKAGTKR
jgi:hypothetical protein